MKAIYTSDLRSYQLPIGKMVHAQMPEVQGAGPCAGFESAGSDTRAYSGTGDRLLCLQS
jgi:hypothetical protein